MMSRDTPVALPISSLLAFHSAPKTPVIHEPLPSPSAAVLGPLPPTTPLHLALNWLYLHSLPEYSHYPESGEAETGGRSERRTGQEDGGVLVVTGSKDGFYNSLEEEDEDWIRDHGGDYDVLSSLKKVHIRYCPSPQHVLLLLTLLSAPNRHEAMSESGEHGAQMLNRAPGLVILWDVAGLFMEEVSGDENNLPQREAPQSPEDQGDDMMEGSSKAAGTEKRFGPSVIISDYLDLLSAARSATEHLSSLIRTSPPIQLLILEPHLEPSDTLPILSPPAPPKQDVERGVAPSKSKRILIADGIRWLFGPDSVGFVAELEKQEGMEDPDPLRATHELCFAAYPDERYLMRRRRCGRGEWASAARNDGGGGVEGDQGGWRWEWC